MSARGSASPVGSLSARLAAEGLSAHAWGNGPGDRYGVHEHGYDKVLVANAGSIESSLPGLGGRSASRTRSTKPRPTGRRRH